VLTQVDYGSEWSVAEANKVMHPRKDDGELAAKLAQCPQRLASWQISLRKRSESQRIASGAADGHLTLIGPHIG
jgi:hypothetical protein